MRRATKPITKPECFRYHDYREFLRDWLAFRRASQSGFSSRSLAAAAGIAPAYLTMVLSGSRNLTAKALSKLKPHLGLSPTELSYFEHLVTLGTSDSQEERLQALHRMKRFQAYRRLNPKEAEAYQYLTHWYYVAIREMAALPDFRLDPEWIQERLGAHVELSAIKEALSFLSKNGYIETDPATGKARPPVKDISCLGGVYRVALTQFHHEMLELATRSISETPSEQRSIQGHIFPVRAGDVDKAKAILSEAIEKIRALESKDGSADSVYHVELALFPLTKNGRKS